MNKLLEKESLCQGCLAPTEKSCELISILAFLVSDRVDIFESMALSTVHFKMILKLS